MQICVVVLLLFITSSTHNRSAKFPAPGRFEFLYICKTSHKKILFM